MATGGSPRKGVQTELAETYSGAVEVAPGVEAFVGVQQMPSQAGGWWGKVELNPSRVADPHGYGLADVAQARRAAVAAWSAMGQLVEPACSLGDARLKRIDVARDFQAVEQPAALIRSLAPVHRPYAKRNLVHADPARNGAQTLMVGSGAGVVRLYDKAAETAGKAPEGTLRWEAECRAWAANYGGMKVLADLTTENVTALAANRWEWSSMGAEVAATSRVVEKVRRSGLTAREQASFLGFLIDQAHGGNWLPGSATLAKFRKIQRDLGIAVGDLGGGEDQAAGLGFTSRLDWATGREVLRAAA